MKSIRIIPLVIAIAGLIAFSARATHQTDEQYDGTVNSFRWLENPIDISADNIRTRADERLALAQFEGKVVLLNLWVSQCPPCIRELPALDRLQRQFDTGDFAVVPVSLDDKPELALKLFADLDIEAMRFYRESAAEMGRHFPIDVLPANLLVGRDGRAIGLLRASADWDAPESRKLIGRLIAGVDTATLRAEQAGLRRAPE